MFIPEIEVERRLRTEENLLNRVSRSESEILSPSSPEIVPPALPFDAVVRDEEEAPLVIPALEEKPEKKNGSSFDFESVDTRRARKELERMLNPSSYPGRGTKDLPRDVQAGIGITSSILGPTKAARLGDVDITGAIAYERGYTGPADAYDPAKSPKEELRDKIIQGHGIIVDKVFNRLLKTLDLLDDEKLSQVKRATDLTVIAKNLSGVVQHATNATQDKGIEVNDNNVHFHIMRPERAPESEYPTIEVDSQTSELAYQERNRES